MRELLSGYVSEFDAMDEQTWCQILREFDDASIYQTWPYEEVRSGRKNISHLVLREKSHVVAVAQSRIAKLPFVDAGIAYVRWGPLWRRNSKANPEVFQQAIRALRNEYACKRGLVLRLYPVLFDDDPPCFASILKEEGFSLVGKDKRDRTILMDLSRAIEDLRRGLKPHWSRELKVAERRGLEIVEGCTDELFKQFIEIYKGMVARKRFVEPNDIYQFRAIQEQLPEEFKMKVMLCRADGDLCAGLICSVMGKRAIYLFGATSNSGMKSRGSYLLQWKLIEQLKRGHLEVYDLNGIDPASNPGTYKFKNDLGGANCRDVYFAGRFDSYANILSYASVRCADTLRTMYQTMRKLSGTRLRRKTVRENPRVGA